MYSYMSIDVYMYTYIGGYGMFIDNNEQKELDQES